MVSDPALLAFFLFWGVQGWLRPFMAGEAAFAPHAESGMQENDFLASLLTDPAASKLPSSFRLESPVSGESFPRPLSGLLTGMQGRFSSSQ